MNQRAMSLPSLPNQVGFLQVVAILGWGAAIFAAMLAWHFKVQASAPPAMAAAVSSGTADVERRVKAEEIARVCAASLGNLTTVIATECPVLAGKLKAAGAVVRP